MMSKRYYWLKLQKSFFDNLFVKILARAPNGDTLIIAYIKLLLLVLESNGHYYYTHFADSINEEISITLNIDTDIINTVLKLLEKGNMIEHVSNDEIIILPVLDFVGSECDSAPRVRESRAKKTEVLQCNTDVTICNTEKETEIKQDTYKELHKENKASAVSDLEKLIYDYGKEAVEKYAERVNQWYKEHGRKLDNEVKVIRDWIEKNKVPRINHDLDKYDFCINLLPPEFEEKNKELKGSVHNGGSG